MALYEGAPITALMWNGDIVRGYARAESDHFVLVDNDDRGSVHRGVLPPHQEGKLWAIGHEPNAQLLHEGAPLTVVYPNNTVRYGYARRSGVWVVVYGAVQEPLMDNDENIDWAIGHGADIAAKIILLRSAKR